MINNFGAGAMFYAKWRRAGDHMHATLGDVEIDCPECHGNGLVDLHNDGQPWGNEKWVTCPNCNGRGTIWVEQ